MKIIRIAMVGAAMFAAAPVCAQEIKSGAVPADARQRCDVPADLLSPGDSVLDKVATAVKSQRKLDVLVVGSGSSGLAGPDGASFAYPARLEANLREKLPGVIVTVTTNLQPKRTAEEVAENLAAFAAERKPGLVVWQTGTVDAIRAIHPDDFRNALDDGIAALKSAGTDAVLMNLQYSPQMETMLPVSPYLENIRAVAQQQDVPLFDRYAIMQHWNEHGDFDLADTSRSMALAKGVHDCVGRALADLVIGAARIEPAEMKVQR